MLTLRFHGNFFFADKVGGNDLKAGTSVKSEPDEDEEGMLFNPIAYLKKAINFK